MLIPKTITLLSLFVFMNSCSAQPAENIPTETHNIVCGAERLDILLPRLKDKKVALVVNQTSLVGTTHLVDTLLSSGISIQRIFAPEHGFRGGADAGEHISDNVDPVTKIEIVSLYGSKKKPEYKDLKDIDLVVFDIQDVGARFYTYISTLHYLMEACAENSKPLFVLDRPNPNGWYVDGPVLESKYKSFVGVDPIPVVHGLTVGEYALMVNSEGWLENGVKCKVTVIGCKNYDHSMRYSLPVKPSPNLPNDVAVFNYPSLCFFEGTDVSVGRGTDWPFQVAGSPQIKVRNFSFVPVSKPGATNPPQQDKVCFGWDLRNVNITKGGIQLSYLINAYQSYMDTSAFFLKTNFFEKLAGTATLRNQITAGWTEAQIKEAWKPELEKYKAIRKKYLLYKDFE